MHLLVVLGKLRCRFFVRLKYARFSAIFCKTHITGAVCTKIQRAEFPICAKQTADSAPSFGTKIPLQYALVGGAW